MNRIFNERDFKISMIELFEKIDNHKTHAMVQLNLTVSNFAKKNAYTYNIFEYEEDLKKKELFGKVQKLRDKFGIDIIKTASELSKE